MPADQIITITLILGVIALCLAAVLWHFTKHDDADYIESSDYTLTDFYINKDWP